MAKREAVRLIVTLSGDRAIGDVTRELTASGFAIEQVLEAIGIVTGVADPTVAPRLRRVSGVSDVSADHRVDIGPPTRDVS